MAQTVLRNTKGKNGIIYLASTVGATKQCDTTCQEKVLFGDSLSDRRHAVDTTKDQRPIIQCVGRVVAHYGKHGNIRTCGTGTVFSYNYEKNTCYVLTCAHNIVDEDEQTKLRTI